MKSDFKKYFFILLSSSLFFFLLILNQDLRNSVIYFDWLYLDGLLSRNLIEKEPSINVTKESNDGANWLRFFALKLANLDIVGFY